MNYGNLFKRLLIMNSMGVYLYGRDGHIWIGTSDESNAYLLSISLNNKIYGGVIQAVDTFDEALQRDGQPSLMDRWNEYGKTEMFLGKGGIDESRIGVVAYGKGGIY